MQPIADFVALLALHRELRDCSLPLEVRLAAFAAAASTYQTRQHDAAFVAVIPGLLAQFAETPVDGKPAPKARAQR